eukprot:COSAG06_NODE_5693_length_3315_cov_330.218216_5_plen_87_part_00
MAAAIGSHKLSLPPIQLSQVLRPASRFKPAAQHISNLSGSEFIHPSIHQPDQSVPIKQSSASLSLTQSINPSIHYCLRHVASVRSV